MVWHDIVKGRFDSKLLNNMIALGKQIFNGAFRNLESVLLVNQVAHGNGCDRCALVRRLPEYGRTDRRTDKGSNLQT